MRDKPIEAYTTCMFSVEIPFDLTPTILLIVHALYDKLAFVSAFAATALIKWSNLAIKFGETVRILDRLTRYCTIQQTSSERSAMNWSKKQAES